MENNNNKQLQAHIIKLEKQLDALAVRVARLETENKKLKSRVINGDQKLGLLAQQRSRQT